MLLLLLSHTDPKVLTRKVLSRLKPGEWLNDDIICYYMDLLNDRAHRQGQRVYCWNTQFWLKLGSGAHREYNYANVQRWTKRKKVKRLPLSSRYCFCSLCRVPHFPRFQIDIFALDRLIVPINVSDAHWSLGVVDFLKKTISYYDSLGNGHNEWAF
jgi:sentrin-specific protease 1